MEADSAPAVADWLRWTTCSRRRRASSSAVARRRRSTSSALMIRPRIRTMAKVTRIEVRCCCHSVGSAKDSRCAGWQPCLEEAPAGKLPGIGKIALRHHDVVDAVAAQRLEDEIGDRLADRLEGEGAAADDAVADIGRIRSIAGAEATAAILAAASRGTQSLPVESFKMVRMMRMVFLGSAVARAANSSSERSVT